MVVVTGPTPQELAQERMRRSPYPVVRRVSCEHRGNVLVLRGRLPSCHHKQVAQETVARLDGVAWVVNEIEVERELLSPSPCDPRED